MPIRPRLHGDRYLRLRPCGRYGYSSMMHREAKDSAPGALRIRSPYDIKTRCSAKYSRSWTGYKVHLSESCDADLPKFMTNLKTAEATDQDQLAIPKRHASLIQKGLSSERHIVDQGYMSTQLIQPRGMSL